MNRGVQAEIMRHFLIMFDNEQETAFKRLKNEILETVKDDTERGYYLELFNDYETKKYRLIKEIVAIGTGSQDITLKEVISGVEPEDIIKKRSHKR